MRNVSVLIVSPADRGGAASIARQDAMSLADKMGAVGYAPEDNLVDLKTIRQHWLPFIKASSLLERLLRLTLGQVTSLLGLVFLVKKFHYDAIINHVPHIGKVCHAACQICGILNIQVIHLPLSSFKAKKWMKPGKINLSLSERGKQDLIEQWGVKRESVYLLPPAIQVKEVSDDELTRNCKIFDIPPRHQTVACVALFNAQKNHESLIHIWEKVVEQEPEAMLLLAGDGPLIGSIKKLVRDRNLTENVRFLGMVEPGWLYERSSFCVLTSKDEGIPLVFLEAAAHQRAFVSFDTGSNSEFIRSNWNGILVPSGDEQSMIASILTCLRQPQKCIELGGHAFESYKKFSSGVNRGELLCNYLDEMIRQE